MSELAVQKYLRSGGTIEQLKNDLGIKVAKHPSENIAILNYDQIDSPKTNEIVRECRALTLNLDTFDIVARSFSRFYNWGEVADEMPLFNWNNCSTSSKEDGSLCILYHWNGKWRINTRGSFGDGECGFSGKTWTEIFFEIIPYETVERCCAPGMSFVFEFCTLHNKVVRSYPIPTLFLLTVFDVNTNYELSDSLFVDAIAESLGCSRPEKFNFKSIDEVTKYIFERGANVSEWNDDEETFVHRPDKSGPDPTFEGVVIRDDQNHRWKVKNPTYLIFHKMRGEGDNLFNPKYLVNFALSNEYDELLAIYPEVEKKFMEVKTQIDSAYINLVDIWEDAKHIESQRDFAQTIVPKTKFSSLLFQCRKLNKHPKDLWSRSENLILKVLFNK